jgi:hypothetical protein
VLSIDTLTDFGFPSLGPRKTSVLSIDTLTDFGDPSSGPRKTLVSSSGTLTACGILDWDLETTTPFFAPGKASDGEDSF